MSKNKNDSIPTVDGSDAIQAAITLELEKKAFADAVKYDRLVLLAIRENDIPAFNKYCTLRTIAENKLDLAIEQRR